eukprot:7204772-Prymnesium_polylepis.2
MWDCFRGILGDHVRTVDHVVSIIGNYLLHGVCPPSRAGYAEMRRRAMHCGITTVEGGDELVPVEAWEEFDAPPRLYMVLMWIVEGHDTWYLPNLGRPGDGPELDPEALPWIVAGSVAYENRAGTVRLPVPQPVELYTATGVWSLRSATSHRVHSVNGIQRYALVRLLSRTETTVTRSRPTRCSPSGASSVVASARGLGPCTVRGRGSGTPRASRDAMWFAGSMIRSMHARDAATHAHSDPDGLRFVFDKTCFPVPLLHGTAFGQTYPLSDSDASQDSAGETGAATGMSGVSRNWGGWVRGSHVVIDLTGDNPAPVGAAMPVGRTGARWRNQGGRPRGSGLKSPTRSHCRARPSTIRSWRARNPWKTGLSESQRGG